jgi:enterochelin esterase-like enzyme
MKRLVSTMLGLLLTASLWGQGVIKESLTIKSATLGRDVKYSVYLPPDYELSTRSYPVLLLLHGFSDDETGWTQFGEVKGIADKALKEGKMTPMIIVMPDGGVSWYINSFDGKVRYEEFLVNEFIPYVDANYRTRPLRRYRAVSGLSMGGYGTCILAMKHPDLFVAAAPLSAGIYVDSEIEAMTEQDWANDYGVPFSKKLKGKDRLNDHYRKNSIVDIVMAADPEELTTVRYYIDCGDDDFLIKGNMALHAAMIDKKIPHEFRVRDGEHNWSYWRAALPEVLKFVSASFHQ